MAKLWQELGKIISTGVRVQIQGDWPDYVFEDDYNKPTLEEVRSFIDDRGHLPGFHPAEKMESEGVDVEEVSIQQQEWIEVNTLHLIDLNNRIKALETQVRDQEQLTTRIEQLEQLVLSQSLAIEKLANSKENGQ